MLTGAERSTKPEEFRYWENSWGVTWKVTETGHQGTAVYRSLFPVEEPKISISQDLNLLCKSKNSPLNIDSSNSFSNVILQYQPVILQYQPQQSSTYINHGIFFHFVFRVLDISVIIFTVLSHSSSVYHVTCVTCEALCKNMWPHTHSNRKI